MGCMTTAAPVEIGISNVEFARRVGCHHTTASRYRSGERVPSTAILLRILAEFDLTEKQRKQLTDAMSKKMSLTKRREITGKWLRANIFTQKSDLSEE